MWRGGKVLGAGVAFGTLVALSFAGLGGPPGASLADRARVWADIMCGPLLGTNLGMANFGPVVVLGWWGLLFVPAHPVYPHWATGFLTPAGLGLWLLSGLITVMVMWWA